jgi:hypothetical protein
MRVIHLIVGLLGIVAFLGTGQYMDRYHAHLEGMPDTQRMLFRSTHIYLLLVSIINAALGLYYQQSAIGWRRILATLGSILLLAAPVLLLVGFCIEPWLTELARPYSRPGLYITLAGIMFHLVAAVGRGRSTDFVSEGRHAR